MLDAAQARIVAYTTEHGEILCAKHADMEYGDQVRAWVEEHKERDTRVGGWNVDVYEGFESLGLRALSRYDVDSWNGEDAYHLDSYDIAGHLIDTEKVMDLVVDAIDAYRSDKHLEIDFAGDAVQAAIDSLSAVTCSTDSEPV